MIGFFASTFWHQCLKKENLSNNDLAMSFFIEFSILSFAVRNSPNQIGPKSFKAQPIKSFSWLTVAELLIVDWA